MIMITRTVIVTTTMIITNNNDNNNNDASDNSDDDTTTLTNNNDNGYLWYQPSQKILNNTQQHGWKFNLSTTVPDSLKHIYCTAKSVKYKSRLFLRVSNHFKPLPTAMHQCRTRCHCSFKITVSLKVLATNILCCADWMADDVNSYTYICIYIYHKRHKFESNANASVQFKFAVCYIKEMICISQRSMQCNQFQDLISSHWYNSSVWKNCGNTLTTPWCRS